MNNAKIPPTLVVTALTFIASQGRMGEVQHNDLPGTDSETIACLGYLFETGLVEGKVLASTSNDEGIVAMLNTRVTRRGLRYLEENRT